MAKRTFNITESSGEQHPAHASNKQNKTLIEHAYSLMRHDIINGTLRPDEKLRVAHLQKTYGVSASTLREAISRLVSEYLVSAEGQRGYKVSSLDLEELKDITELRVLIEVNAVRESVRNSTDAWREQLTIVFHELSKHEQPINPENSHKWEALNAQFHQILCYGKPSPWTKRTLNLLAQHSERYIHLAIKIAQSNRDVHAEHSTIYEAAMAGNELRAALAIEDHIRATTRYVVNNYKPQT